MGGQLSGGLGALEIGVGGRSLPRIAEFAELQVLGVDAVGQLHVREHDHRLAGRGRHGREVRIGAQQRELPGDPHAPATGFAVGDPLQSIAEHASERLEGLGHGVQADRPHQVNALGQAVGVSHDGNPPVAGVARHRTTDLAPASSPAHHCVLQRLWSSAYALTYLTFATHSFV